MAQFLKLKKDFGLGSHRVTLPPEGGGESPPTEGESGNRNDTSESSPNSARRVTSSSSPSISRLFKGVKGLFSSKQVEQKAESPLLSHSPSSNTSQDLIDFDEDCPGEDNRPSPLLHSRVLKKEMIGEGVKGSLENLKTQYGISSDEEDITEDNRKGGDGLLKLVVKSNGSNRQLMVKRDPDGLGIRLSSGSAPIIITQVEPDSEAMLAGIKVSDTILEVNGRDCRELESEEVLKILQLKSLIKKSPRISKSMKPSLTITSIDDSDIDDDDEDDIFSFDSSQDKVSIDEELFEYNVKKDSKVDLMPSVKEETHEDSVSKDNKDLLIDLSETVNGTTSREPPLNGVSENGFHVGRSPVKGLSPSRSMDDNSVDLLELPVSTGDRLGVDVGRYKRDIGNARKGKKPTRRRPSSVMVRKTGDSSSDLWEKDSEMRTGRTYSSSSITSEKKEPPLPMPRQQKPPPVAVKRTKSGSLNTSTDDTLQPPQQDDKTPRRYTVGGAMLGGGGNAQLLAQAASAKIKQRASVKRNDSSSRSENDKQTTSTPSEKPAWMTALNKKKQGKNNGIESSTNDTEKTKDTVTTPVKSAQAAATPNKDVVTPKAVIPPKKPPRTREKIASNDQNKPLLVTQAVPGITETATTPSKPPRTSQTSKTNIADIIVTDGEGTDNTNKSSNETNVNTDSTPKKPPVTPRRVSGSMNRNTSAGVIQEHKTTPPEDKPSLSIQTTESKVDKPAPTPRKPSIDQQKKQEPKESNDKTDSKIDQAESKVDKPAPTPRKPSMDQHKKQEPKESNDKMDSSKSKTDQENNLVKVPKDKPAFTPRKPSIDRKKLEPKDIVSKQSETTNEGKPKTKLSASSEETKAPEISKNDDGSESTERKDSTRPAIGSVKSRLAMFEKK